MTNCRFFLKNVATIVACFAATLVFSAAIMSCNKDDDNNGLSTSPVTSITASVDGGNALNNLIDEVKLITWNPYDYDDPIELASAKFTNGGFKIDLPETVSPDALDILPFNPSINISDKSVKVVSYTNTIAVDEDGERIGVFECYKEDGKTWVAMGLWYADGDVTITGKETTQWGITNFNISLKKGWNQVFFIEDETSWEETITTTTQSGLKWVFSSNDYDDETY